MALCYFFYDNGTTRSPVANFTDKSDNFLEILENCSVARVAACEVLCTLSDSNYWRSRRNEAILKVGSVIIHYSAWGPKLVLELGTA